MSEKGEQQKTAVVTGGAGFVGSHLCERLRDEGYRVISLDNYFTGSKDNHVDGVEYRDGHTKDIAEHIPETPDIIYHLGEYPRVEQSVLEPALVEDLNTRGTAGVISYWKQTGCKLVYAGSSTKFGDGGATRYESPYARTKACNSEKVATIGMQETLPYSITYFYNVYGPGERSGIYGTVIAHFQRMYRSGTPCAVVAPGTQERNFTHVADIVEGLVRVGEAGSNAEYGLGCEQSHSILGVAEMFGFADEQIVMFPERPGNRMRTELDTTNARALGWGAQHNLSTYIADFISSQPRGAVREKRVLLFATTMPPISGLAEDAFIELATQLPEVTFDVVTTRFTRTHDYAQQHAPNINMYRVGIGAPVDKFLLPLLGSMKGIALTRTHQYLLTWSLMASYAAMAGAGVKIGKRMPLLITLADQNLENLSRIHRWILRLVVRRSDQVYGTHGGQEQEIQKIAQSKLPRNSIGEGDAFANALRFAYADIVRKGVVSSEQ